jgi:hypothetical protein
VERVYTPGREVNTKGISIGEEEREAEGLRYVEEGDGGMRESKREY